MQRVNGIEHAVSCLSVPAVHPVSTAITLPLLHDHRRSITTPVPGVLPGGSFAFFYSPDALNDFPRVDVLEKAAPVVLFFMHVNSADGVTRAVTCTGVVWLIVTIVLTLIDILTRR